MKRRTLKTLAGLLLAAASAGAIAQTAPFPSRTITMVVPYAPGGSSDTRARQVAGKMATLLGVPVVVDNKPGAAGNIGTDFIAKANPDGHVIGIGNLAPLAVNKYLFNKMNFDAATDVTPIALIEKGPLVLLVSADKSPFKSFADVVAYGKANPGKLSYASAGTGGSFHLAGELLEDATGVPMLHVPYKGGGPATTDLLAGNVSFMFDMVPASLPYAKANPPKARALAVANDKRLPQFPDVPTFAELGIKGLEVSNWFGVIAPKGTPAAVVAKLNDAVNRALKDPELAERITSQGNVIGGGSAEEFGRFIAAESARWGKVIKEKKIQAD
ncbi:tripartite tricarboxylate transporter substrate binding protein [Ramlibacter sp. XY19]|uniref:Bug family tripartite tricarboxylate transporter substrate binding protein n=1 Tax=Ramlibacter paludis TaxID=2908000 RepID=UPI0023DC3C2F|nr:tripartite tricarboxylate transporter substrate binding protein [Ramlibacter paludis]MCG2591462.1 tripartite tricarboxylate transporter substrate binding protein [Ramlibacter paludis]